MIVWQLERTEASYGFPKKALTGHSHYVEDVVISSDGQFALSGSWDGTLRLWELTSGTTTRRFVGHTKDVLSVAFSADNRQVSRSSRRSGCRWRGLLNGLAMSAQCRLAAAIRGQGSSRHVQERAAVAEHLCMACRWHAGSTHAAACSMPLPGCAASACTCWPNLATHACHHAASLDALCPIPPVAHTHTGHSTQ